MLAPSTHKPPSPTGAYAPTAKRGSPAARSPPQMATAAAVPPAVERERVEEDARMSLSPPAVDVDIIRYTRVYLDSDGDFVIEFENHERAYGFLVVLQDQNALGWRECQALSECIKIASRGAEINNDLFVKHCEQLTSAYVTTNGPMLENERLMFLVDPGPSQPKSKDDHVIERVSLFFDCDGDLVIEAYTYGRSTYVIVLALDGEDLFLTIADCNAFVDVLLQLEPGDPMTLRTFLCNLSFLRNKYNFITLASEKGVVTCLIHASSVKNDQPEYKAILFALAEERNIRAAAEARAKIARENAARAQAAAAAAAQPATPANGYVPSPPPPVLPHCPYPNMWYTRALQQSGQAQVYAGQNTAGQRVAIKVFSGAAHSAAVTYRLELRMLLKMPEHRNVISVLEFFETPQPALVMHLIEGAGDILQYLRVHGAIEEKDARQIAVELADGVAHLHRSGIVHRDLKSANVLLRKSTSTGRLTPVIIDLGLGGALRKSGRESNAGALGMITMEQLEQSFAQSHIAEKTISTKGTVLWMAPEMILNQEWSEKTDVFAFGIILWEMLSGAVPYSHLVVTSPWDLLFRIANGARPDIGRIASAPAELRELIEHCWAQNPKHRPTMMQVLDKLRGNDPKAIFNSIDSDGSKTLNFAELVGFLGRYAPDVSARETVSVFEAIDEDGSGDITFDEFLGFWNIVQRRGLPSALALCQRGKRRRSSVRNEGR